MLELTPITSSQARAAALAPPPPDVPAPSALNTIRHRGSEQIMKVRDAMSQLVLTVGPAHTLRQAAKMMAAQRVGSAVVLDHERSGVGILTERDILLSLGSDQDPDNELVAHHQTPDVVFAAPDWTLEQAARTMISGGFRHLVVVDSGDVTGLLSMRDIVRSYTSGPAAGATAQGSSVGSATGSQ